MGKEKTKETEKKQDDSSQEVPLFRKEALEAKKGSYFGKTLIVAPISFSAWSLGLFLIAVAISLFVYFGEYSKRHTAKGMLIPDKGLVTLHAKSSGTVSGRYVQQGDKVKKDQLLFLVSTEHETSTEQTYSAQQEEILQKQIEVQKNRINMYEKNAAGYEDLLNKHYISEVEYQARQNEYLAAKVDLHKLERELGEIKRTADYAVHAPIDGIVSALIATVGDHVTQEASLVSIVPEGSVLEGVLFVPNEQIGFAKSGQKVLLKFDAYPYQQFGLYESIINRIDKSLVLPNEIRLPIEIKAGFYRIIVTLKSQEIMAYGKPQPLVAGMLFDGVILGEKRRIWQWVMEPLYSLKGNVGS